MLTPTTLHPQPTDRWAHKSRADGRQSAQAIVHSLNLFCRLGILEIGCIEFGIYLFGNAIVQASLPNGSKHRHKFLAGTVQLGQQLLQDGGVDGGIVFQISIGKVQVTTDFVHRAIAKFGVDLFQLLEEGE